ncbi:COMM domain-containing protein 9-like isoform X2 [Ostrea edulis]|uniref:COMM domain-containing protein 9-like isoform X2 n=1 Tax=Ostrea edulis TaxID=37623 RepID=UPI002094475A|nr:COMM domain-containing protein 9-like isoform X2 [Ostrea edulis]
MASSKDQVVKICNDVYLMGSPVSELSVSPVCDALGTRLTPTKQMMESLSTLLTTIIFHGYTEPREIQSLFPKDFHKNLRDLITKTALENMNNWKNHSISSQVSLPRLVDFDWRVDTKMASDAVSRMSVPTCILQMKVQENQTEVNTTPEVNNVNVELSKETLDTMLDGLSKIRDQLSSVAKR